MKHALTLLSRQVKASGSIVDLCEDRVLLPDGKVESWDFVHHKKGCGAAVVPVLPDGRILLVTQFRPAVGEEMLELPAGGKDPADASLLETARRELLEETGYTADAFSFLCRARTAVAWCNEYTEVYLARDIRKVQAPHLDEAEDIRRDFYTKEELLSRIQSGALTDAKTIAGLCAYFSMM